MASLLGVEVEYYASVLGLMERMRQLEQSSERIISHFEPISLLLTSDNYLHHLREMLLEAAPRGGAKGPRPADIEQMLVRHIFGRVLRELSYAFETIAVTKPALLALESNAQFVQAAAPTDPVVVARMELAVGNRTSKADLCLPYAMLAPALEAVTRSADRGEKIRQRSAAAARTTQRLNDVEVDVSIRFDPIQLPSSQIGQLAVGDVLNLGHRTSKPLSITSATSTFAIAVPGASGKQLAALIVEP